METGNRAAYRRLRRKWTTGLAIVVAIGAAACSPAQVPGGNQSAPAQPAPQTTLRMVTRFEPKTMASKLPNLAGTSEFAVRPFNAGLAVVTGTLVPHPVLTEQLPQLNTDSWRVFPDGKMQVTYKLRAGLTWHDGTP